MDLVTSTQQGLVTSWTLLGNMSHLFLIVPHSTAQHIAAQHSAAQHSAAQPDSDRALHRIPDAKPDTTQLSVFPRCHSRAARIRLQSFATCSMSCNKQHLGISCCANIGKRHLHEALP